MSRLYKCLAYGDCDFKDLLPITNNNECLFASDFNLDINIRPTITDMEGADLVVISAFAEQVESMENVCLHWLHYFSECTCPIVFVFVYESGNKRVDQSLVSSIIFHIMFSYFWVICVIPCLTSIFLGSIFRRNPKSRW